MSDGFDITSEEGDFIHINYVNSEEDKPGNADKELYGDENEWVLVQKSNNSKPEPQLDYQDCPLEHSKPCLESSYYELVSESLKEHNDETTLETQPPLFTSEIDAEVLYMPDEKLNSVVPGDIDNNEYDESDFLFYGPAIKDRNFDEDDYSEDIDNEEYRFIHEYNEEVDMCTKSKVHSELLDINPNGFMGVDTKNDLLGGRSRKRRCKKIALNKKTDISSPLYSFRINKDSLWVYKNV